MAYMHGLWYVWSDGECLHVWGPPDPAQWEDGRVGLAIPNKTAEELALMLVSQMDTKTLKRVARRVKKKHGGNFGADAVVKALGGKGVMERIAESRTKDGEESQ